MTSTVTKSATREAYGQVLVELGREDPNIVVLGGDLNKSTGTWAFAQQFPERFFDLGAAEQNIMGIAAGLASAGKTVFASTFAVFGTGRPYDQIRLSIAQPGLNVKIVVTHAGIITGEDGMSAQSIEDIALMCALPTFTVVVPADAPETAAAVREAARTQGPWYIRLGRPATPVVHQDGYRFHLGRAEQLKGGSDVTVIACGVMVSAALEAAEVLEGQGVRCRVLNMATLKPTDEEAIIRAAKETGALVTAEEHYIHGGLNSIVCQAVGRLCPVPVEPVALTRYAESGDPSGLLRKYGLTAEDVVAAVRRALSRRG
ncbi:MAG: transketolase family protein [Chloroflexi bacterium]|nr:transketolase family protein [Chloroflexota bacterium]